MRKTHVSFRVSLPPHAHPSTVRVLGSWDDFTTPLLLEQDKRVGRDVWKGLFTVNGGLEMGSEHLYYYLLDSEHPIPDPQSAPSELMVDPRSGRLVSVLYVPVEVPAEDNTAPPAVKTGDIDRQEGLLEKHETVTPVSTSTQSDGSDSKVGLGSFRQKPRIRSSFFADVPDPKPRRKSWGLNVSTSFLRSRGFGKLPEQHESVGQEDFDAPSGTLIDAELRDIANYIHPGISIPPYRDPPVFASPTSPRNGTFLSSCSSGTLLSLFNTPSSSPPTEHLSPFSFYAESTASEEGSFVRTPIDHPEGTAPGGNRDIGLYVGGVFEPPPDEGLKPLRWLRDEIEGEIRWREEVGWLGGVVG